MLSKATKVNVTAKDAKNINKKVGINEALELLRHPKTQWELKDAKFKFNGNDIIKNTSAKNSNRAD